MINSFSVITPAYGRDYKSKAEAEKDFRAGKDFILQSWQGSAYCGIRDFTPGIRVQIRYSKLRKATIIIV